MDVINLVSSDEEDNEGGLRKGILKSNKNLTIKKVKTQSVGANRIPSEKLAPPLCQNNNKLTVIHVNKNPKPINNTHQLKDLNHAKNERNDKVGGVQHKICFPQAKVTDKQKTIKLTSGITITPLHNINSNCRIEPMPAKTIPTQNPMGFSSKSGAVTITPTSTLKPQPSMKSQPSNVVVRPSGTVLANSTIITKSPKRIIPKQISNKVTARASSIEKSSDSDMLSRDSSVPNDDVPSSTVNHSSPQKTDREPPSKRPKLSPTKKTPMHQDYMQLIETCKTADPSEDMKKIVLKLTKYYHKVHVEYVNSKSFLKLVREVTHEIKIQPKLIYMKINNLLEEMRTRRTNDVAAPSDEAAPAKDVDVAKTKKIQKLNVALQILQKKIIKSEEAEVDLDDELNSVYLLTERLKKRACEIYEKLCDLTGESRTAERMLKKPIKFNGTSYPEFNRKLEKFINETKSFPDMFDVLRIMEHCCKAYNYGLSKEHRKSIAQEAFHRVGNLLQKRRKLDLYEMVQHFTCNNPDPAGQDSTLKIKLEENQKHYSKRMKEVIDRFSYNHAGYEDKEDEKSPEKINVKDHPNASSSINSTRKSNDISKPMPTIAETFPVTLSSVQTLIKPECDDIDMLNDIADLTRGDAVLIDEQDVEELAKEFYPTIKSVTSLHPSEFNEFMNFETGTIEGNIL